MKRRRMTGFTLLELLLVISLIALLAVLTWPNLDTASRSEHLDESARRMKALIAMCRAEAMSEALRYRITFRLDGSIKVRRQFDPIRAPHVFVPVERDWAQRAVLLEEVWVESVALLPDGPAPILVDDELKEFDDMEEDFEPLPIADFERPIDLHVEPDGTSGSLLWVLRHARGRGIEMTLDGRLGRVKQVPVEALEEQRVTRPDEIDLAAEAEEERAQWEEFGWERERVKR